MDEVAALPSTAPLRTPEQEAAYEALVKKVLAEGGRVISPEDAKNNPADAHLVKMRCNGLKAMHARWGYTIIPGEEYVVKVRGAKANAKGVAGWEKPPRPPKGTRRPGRPRLHGASALRRREKPTTYGTKPDERVAMFDSTAEKMTPIEHDEVNAHMRMGEHAQEYTHLRARGMTKEEAVKEMDRLRGITDRTRENRVAIANSLEEQTQLYQLTVLGIDHLTDAQWRGMKNAILLNCAQRPGPNASASLRAIELIDKQRNLDKFGTREAVEKTLKRCEERMAQLVKTEEWGKLHGVEGGSGAALQGEPDTSPQDGTGGEPENR